MSFRILNQAPQFLLPSGAVNAGGSLTFYETDLTTKKNTWSDEAMAVLNSNPVMMDSAGRTVTDVWGDGEYGVVMADAFGVVQWTRNNVRADAGTGTTLPDPAGQAGKFVISNGSVYVLEDFFLLPDPTGLDNYMLVSDGEAWIPQQQPEPPEIPDPEVVVTANTFQAGISDNTTKYFTQTGTGSAPASGTPTTTVTVTYPVPMTTVTFVGITVTSNSQPGGPVVPNTTAISGTAFSAQFDVAEANGSGSPDIVNPVPFVWIAVGTLVVP